MRRRGCLISLGVIAGLLLLCCVLGWFVAIPRFRDTVADSISEELSTQVADQLQPPSGTLEPGTYTLSVAELQRQIDANMEDSSTTSDFGISIDQNQLVIDFDAGSQTFGYSGTPTVRDGKLVIDDMEVDSDQLGWVMPADRVADIIEDGVNDYFASQNLSIESIDLGEDEIEFQVVPAD
jgi:hypothetical protein